MVRASSAVSRMIFLNLDIDAAQFLPSMIDLDNAVSPIDDFLGSSVRTSTANTSPAFPL